MKNLFIHFYMLFVKIIAFVCRLFPLQKKMVMLITFPGNIEPIITKMTQLSFTPKTFLFCHPRLQREALTKDFTQIKSLKKTNLISFLFQLSTAKVVVIDNYFPELAAISFRHQNVFQIWHANGALKKFGWEDKSVAHRSQRDQFRFKKVYSKFQNIIVGSDKMATIFKKSFLVNDKNLIKIGVPSTDYFYDQTELKRTSEKWRAREGLNEKKLILYAPTFRDGELNAAKILLDIELMREKLADQYILLLKLHPSISMTEVPEKKDSFVKQIPSHVPMHELLALADLLITDYSSSPFEYAILGRPIYFFTPDIEEYAENRGLIDDFLKEIPGPHYKTTAELIEAIQYNRADRKEIEAFSAKWNQYSDGHSTKRFVAELQKRMNGGLNK